MEENKKEEENSIINNKEEIPETLGINVDDKYEVKDKFGK